MSLEKTSTPIKCQEPLQNLPFSPISPSNPENFDSQVIQIKFSEEDEKIMLAELEKKFADAIFHENGKIFYPISTNRDFHGFTYNIDQEFRNNFIIQTEIFSRYYYRRL